jgi:hypothetical protein
MSRVSDHLLCLSRGRYLAALSDEVFQIEFLKIKTNRAATRTPEMLSTTTTARPVDQNPLLCGGDDGSDSAIHSETLAKIRSLR